MRDLVGARLIQELDADHYDDEELAQADRLTAWPVPALVGATVEVEEFVRIGDGVRKLMSEALPGIDWFVEADWQGPFRKYGFLHGSLPAPPNEATGEAMAIELFGVAEGIAEPGTEAWFESLHEILRNGDDGGCAVSLPARVTIRVAVYSNLMYPGLGVPTYM